MPWNARRAAGARTRWVIALGVVSIAVLLWRSNGSGVPLKSLGAEKRSGEPGLHRSRLQIVGDETPPAQDSELREEVPDLPTQLAEAETIDELKRLLAASNPPADGAERFRRLEEDFRRDLEARDEALRAHRAAPDRGPDSILVEKKLLLAYLEAERDLTALERGNYVFGEIPTFDHPRFEIHSDSRWSDPPEESVLWCLDRRESLLYYQLSLEIDCAEKIASFNKMNESMRRRVLYLREKSLLEDPPEEQRWISTYFPPEFRIDEASATIW